MQLSMMLMKVREIEVDLLPENASISKRYFQAALTRLTSSSGFTVHYIVKYPQQSSDS